MYIHYIRNAATLEWMWQPIYKTWNHDISSARNPYLCYTILCNRSNTHFNSTIYTQRPFINSIPELNVKPSCEEVCDCNLCTILSHLLSVNEKQWELIIYLAVLGSLHPVIRAAFTATQSPRILSRARRLNRGGSRLCSGISGSRITNNIRFSLKTR